MANSFEGKDVSTALAQAVASKESRAETPVTFAYEAGTPIRFGREVYGGRFANENPTARKLVARYIEESGGLGPVADDRKFKPGQEYFKGIVAAMQGAQEAGIFLEA